MMSFLRSIAVAVLLASLCAACEKQKVDTARGPKTASTQRIAAVSSPVTLPTWPPGNLRDAKVTRDHTLLGPGESFWKDLNTPLDQVLNQLENSRVVNKREWETNYSHVAGQDQMGWIVYPDGARAKWLVRPGGLAMVQTGEGEWIYLVLR